MGLDFREGSDPRKTETGENGGNREENPGSYSLFSLLAPVGLFSSISLHLTKWCCIFVSCHSCDSWFLSCCPVSQSLLDQRPKLFERPRPQQADGADAAFHALGHFGPIQLFNAAQDQNLAMIGAELGQGVGEDDAHFPALSRLARGQSRRGNQVAERGRRG